MIMDYNILKMGAYNIHTIKTKKFKTITVEVNFRREVKKEEITIRNVLKAVLLNSNSYFPSEKELIKETEELYDLGISSNPHKSGNYHIISFKESFLNEKYTEDGMNLKSMQFLLELIFNANVSDNKFD